MIDFTQSCIWALHVFINIIKFWLRSQYLSKCSLNAFLNVLRGNYNYHICKVLNQKMYGIGNVDGSDNKNYNDEYFCKLKIFLNLL